MNKFISYFIITSLLCSVIITPSFASTPTPAPTSTTPASEEVTENLSTQINSLKEKIASRVAQLNLVEKRGVMGTVTEVKGMQITLVDPQGKTQIAEVDEITKFSSSSQSNYGISDIKKNDKLSIIGLYNKDSERILARFVQSTTIPQFISGAITSIDDKNVRRIGKVHLFIPFFLEQPRNRRRFRVVEFASQRIKSDFFHIEGANLRKVS